MFAKWEGKASLQVLDLQLFPKELAELSPEKIVEHIRRKVKRGVGLKKVHLLQEVARQSIGITEGTSLARRKLGTLLRHYHFLQEELEALREEVEEMLEEIPGAKEMTAIHGIGKVTVAGFFAEVGDLSAYESPEQIIKLAGLNLKLATSGKWKGQTVITKRGRPKLRSLLYKVILVLVSHNKAFKALHHYFITRHENPLKKKQSLIALCCKLIRILFIVGKNQRAFSEEKMLNDIPHFRQQEVA